MEYITTVHVNCVSEERREEYTNWYNYVHFRDVMNMPGHISAQRFCRSKYQPKHYFDDTFEFWTIYELRTKAESTAGHQAAIMSWKMQITSAMDFSNYKESYWDGVYGNVPYSCYSEYGQQQNCLIALIGGDVENVFTQDVVFELGNMDGVYAANLYHYAPDQMAKATAKKEEFTHQLIIQCEDARDAIASWDAFCEENEALKGLQIAATCYTSMHPRLKMCDSLRDEKDRAISSLYHMFTNLPGYHAANPANPPKYTDILTPAIKQKLEMLDKK